MIQIGKGNNFVYNFCKKICVDYRVGIYYQKEFKKLLKNYLKMF